jgi:hypothetical protein
MSSQPSPYNPPSKFFYTFVPSFGAPVTMLRGDGTPKIVGGLGGWNLVQRPRRVSLTQWGGTDPYQMDVPVLFDGVRGYVSVEDDIRRLNAMAFGSDYNEPPTVTIVGALPVGGATWVISGIDYGDDVMWDEAGSGRGIRYRQDAIVHLVEYEAEARLKITVTNSLPNIYVVTRKGETLRGIAKLMYGNANKWKAIKAANPVIRDPNKLPLHLKIRLP